MTWHHILGRLCRSGCGETGFGESPISAEAIALLGKPVYQSNTHCSASLQMSQLTTMTGRPNGACGHT